MEISIFMNFVFISGLFMSLSYLLYKDQKNQDKAKKEQKYVQNSLNSTTVSPVVITIEREMLEIPGMSNGQPSKDLNSFGFDPTQVYGCKKTSLVTELSPEVVELLKSCVKNGLTRGIEVVTLAQGIVPESLKSHNLYLVLSGANPLVAKLYAYVSKH